MFVYMSVIVESTFVIRAKSSINAANGKDDQALILFCSVLELTLVLLGPYIYAQFQACSKSKKISLNLIKKILVA